MNLDFIYQMYNYLQLVLELILPLLLDVHTNYIYLDINQFTNKNYVNFYKIFFIKI